MDCECGFNNLEHEDWCHSSLKFLLLEQQKENEIFQSGSFFDGFLLEGLDYQERKSLIFDRYFSDED
jgi:hypothetical protein